MAEDDAHPARPERSLRPLRQAGRPSDAGHGGASSGPGGDWLELRAEAVADRLMTDAERSTAELRGLLRFAQELGLDKATGREIHQGAAQEAEMTLACREKRMAEALRQEASAVEQKLSSLSLTPVRRPSVRNFVAISLNGKIIF